MGGFDSREGLGSNSSILSARLSCLQPQKILTACMRKPEPIRVFAGDESLSIRCASKSVCVAEVFPDFAVQAASASGCARNRLASTVSLRWPVIWKVTTRQARQCKVSHRLYGFSRIGGVEGDRL